MRSRLILLLSVLALVVAACGGGTDTGQPGDDETSPTETAMDTETSPAADDTATETEMADGEATVAVASSDLGDILVDGEGMTLYLFVPDDQGTPTCTEGCAETWPVLEGPASAGEGADSGMLGTAEHPSGVTQVTYNGWPLYYFAQDQEPGDVNGQGIGENWYVLNAEGEAIEDSSASSSVDGY